MLNALVALWLWSLAVTSGCFVMVLLVQRTVSAVRGFLTTHEPAVAEVLRA